MERECAPSPNLSHGFIDDLSPTKEIFYGFCVLHEKDVANNSNGDII